MLTLRLRCQLRVNVKWKTVLLSEAIDTLPPGFEVRDGKRNDGSTNRQLKQASHHWPSRNAKPFRVISSISTIRSLTSSESMWNERQYRKFNLPRLERDGERSIVTHRRDESLQGRRVERGRERKETREWQSPPRYVSRKLVRRDCTMCSSRPKVVGGMPNPWTAWDTSCNTQCTRDYRSESCWWPSV